MHVREVLLVALMLVSSASPLLMGHAESSASAVWGEVEPAAVGLEDGAPSFDPTVSFRFIQNGQEIDLNRFKDLSEIHHIVGIHRETAGVAEMNSSLRGTLIARLQSYQNADGGFGDWDGDRSKAGSTRMAVETLLMLGASPLNISGVERFIGRLQVSGLTYGDHGFRSSIKESDADISTTWEAVRALSLLGLAVPNATGVEQYVHDHRNEDGGYGYQTNRHAGVYWPSTTLHTERALLTLQLLDAAPEEPLLTEDFLLSTQAAGGGFGNDASSPAKVAYTLVAILAFEALGLEVPRSADVRTFLAGNQLASGGWVEYDLDVQAGLHSTHYALRALGLLGDASGESGALTFLDTTMGEIRDGGFGNRPGMDSNVRVTFDAVTALNLIGRSPNNRTAAADFLLGARNADGGYGYGGSSVESTYRSIAGLARLGVDAPNASETIAFIRSAQNDDGGFGFSADRPSTGAYTYRAVQALYLLGSSPVDVEGAVSHLQGLQNGDGGFGNRLGAASGLGSTYRASRALQTLGSTPLDADAALAFVAGCRNADGGYRLTPTSAVSPGNLSTAINTYNAIGALRHLPGSVGESDTTWSFLKSLRNPDLGFAKMPDFTSEVDDSFLAIQAARWLENNMSAAPRILSESVNRTAITAGENVTFNLTYDDPRGILPDAVLLEVDGIREPMPLSFRLPAQSRMERALSVGPHTVRFILINGGFEVAGTLMHIEVQAVGSPPTVNLSLDLHEGDVDTMFRFEARYEDAEGDPPVSVRLQLDRSDWFEMPAFAMDGDVHVHVLSMSLEPGRHNVRVRVSDGINIVYTDNLQAPLVHSPDASRPDWDTFQRIESLIQREKGQSIGIDDVSATIREGQQAWVVVLPAEVVYVDLTGASILADAPEEDGNPLNGIDPSVLLSGAGVLILILLVLAIGGRRRGGDRRRGRRRSKRDAAELWAAENMWD